MAESPDDIPIEVLAADGEVSTEASITGQSPSPMWVLLAGVVIAALAFLVVTADDGPTADEAADDPSPSTSPDTSAPTTSGVEARADPVTVAPGRAGPLLGRSFDASLLLGGVDSGWSIIDLDDGSVRPAPFLDGVPARAITPVRGGVAIVDVVDAVPVVFPVTDGDEPVVPRRLDVAGIPGRDPADPAVLVLAADDPDELWVLHVRASGSSPGLRATLLGLDGDVLAGPIDVPGTPIAATSRSVVFDVGGRTFLAGTDGIDQIGPGTAYDAAGGVVARAACDEVARCAESIHDVDAAATSTGPLLPTQAVSDGRITMVLSRQGGLVTVAGFAPQEGVDFTPAVTLRVTPRGGQSAVIDVPSIRAAPAWLPDGESLLVLTNIGLQHISIEEGLLAGRRIEGVDVGASTSVFVIPGGGEP